MQKIRWHIRSWNILVKENIVIFHRQYFHIALQIHIADFLKEQDAKAYLSLYAGSGKMYKVSNTKKFVSDYYHKKKITLGKEFCFMPGECAFDEQSVPVLDYLTEILESTGNACKTYLSNLLNRQEVVRHVICSIKCFIWQQA